MSKMPDPKMYYNYVKIELSNYCETASRCEDRSVSYAQLLVGRTPWRLTVGCEW